MKYTLSQVLPKIQKLSRRFDKKDSYIGKSWVLVDELHRALMELEFFKDGRLLMILNGTASWGKWEISPNTNRLILDFGRSISVYEVSFVDHSIMFARQSGTRSLEVFVNKVELPALMYEFYLESLLSFVEKQPHEERTSRRSDPRQENYNSQTGYSQKQTTTDGPSLFHYLVAAFIVPLRSLKNLNSEYNQTTNFERMENSQSFDTKMIFFILLGCVIVALFIGTVLPTLL